MPTLCNYAGKSISLPYFLCENVLNQIQSTATNGDFGFNTMILPCRPNISDTFKLRHESGGTIVFPEVNAIGIYTEMGLLRDVIILVEFFRMFNQHEENESRKLFFVKSWI